MKWNMWRCAIQVFLCVLLFAPPAHANVILPLWMWSWGAMILALLPIIAIEAAVIWVRAGTLLWQSGLAATAGNLVSTLIGIPVAVILHAMLGTRVDDTPNSSRTVWEKIRMVVWQMPYVIDEEGRFPDWMSPCGCLVLLVPFFLASWLSEFWVAHLLLGGNSAWRLGHAIFEANLVTYGILAALLTALLIWCIRNPNIERASIADSDPALEPTVPWRVANKRSQRGIDRLKVKEVEILSHKPERATGEIQEEPALDSEKAAKLAVPPGSLFSTPVEQCKNEYPLKSRPTNATRDNPAAAAR